MPRIEDTASITQLLKNADSGNLNEVLSLTYDELKKIAQSFFTGKKKSSSIQPTVLVHEAFLRLQQKKGFEFKSRGHFFAFLGTIMRHVLIDHFRSEHAEKRGGLQTDITLVTGFGSHEKNWNLFDLDRALSFLERKDTRKARVVELKFFAGATHPEIAEVLGVSIATVERDWVFARAWLHAELT